MTTSPAGLATSVTYNGSTTAPTSAGSYAVVATITASGYSGTASGALVIARAPATVALGNLSASYDGNPHDATATTSPASLSVSITYNGSTTAPTSAGNYAVIATVTDANHTGSATGTLTISQTVQSATVTLSNLTAIYTGATHTATVTTTPAGLAVSVTYNGSATAPTTVGSYAVLATITFAGYTGSATGTLVIAKATATVTLGNLTAAYNGSPHGANVTTAPAGLNVSITYSGSTTPPTAIGSYTVVATVMDTNYAGSATGTLVIGGPVTADFSFTATGPTAQTAAPLASVTYNFSVTPNAGAFPSAVTFAASGLPSGSTVVFSPASLPAASSGMQVVSMTVTAPAAHGQLLHDGSKGEKGVFFALLLLPVMMRRKLRERLSQPFALALCAAAGLLGTTLLIGCGTGNGFSLEQSRDYTVAVTATSGTVQHSATVILNVQ